MCSESLGFKNLLGNFSMVVYGKFNKRREANELDEVVRELTKMTGFSQEELCAEMARKGHNILMQMDVVDPLDAVANFRLR